MQIINKYMSDFPDFNLECQRLIGKGFKTYNFDINISLNENTSSTVITVLMEDSYGKRICLTQCKKENEREEFEPIKKKLVSVRTEIKLSREEVIVKEFKKSFKGYDCNEVDTFLDLVAEDYNQIEKLVNISQLNGVSKIEEVKLSQNDSTHNLYNLKVKLSELENINKEFKKNFRGYDCDEVDRFLNLIVEDYSQFRKTLSELEQ